MGTFGIILLVSCVSHDKDKRTDITEEGSREILGRALEHTTENLPSATSLFTRTGPMTPPNPQEKPNMAYALVAFVSSKYQYNVRERLVELTGDISNRSSENSYGTSEDSLN